VTRRVVPRARLTRRRPPILHERDDDEGGDQLVKEVSAFTRVMDAIVRVIEPA